MIEAYAELIAVIPQDSPTDRDVTPIDESRDHALLHCAGLQAGDGALVEAFSSLQGNDTLVNVFKVDPHTGTRTALATVAPPPQFKLDDFDMWQSGANLIIGLVAHEAITSPTRRNIYARAVVPGVLVPYPGGAEPRGAWIDPALLGGSPEPPPVPSEPVDYARIGLMVQGQVDRLAGQFGGHPASIRSGLEEKAADALVWLLTAPDSDPRIAVARTYRDALFAFHRSLVGAQLWEAFIRARLVPPVLAPQWVHGLDGFPWGVSG